MERPKCGICSKVFSNRRALGGHMRTHLATLPLPPKKEPQISTSSSFCNSSSSSLEQRESDEEERVKDQGGLVYGLRNKPKKAFKLGVQDRESDTEAETTKKSPTRKRSKRIKRMVLALQAEVSTTSMSYTSPEEDVAMCLVMLSRDVWTGSDDTAELRKPGQTRGRKYQCETCKKVFKSFQALGGHRTSHRKINDCCFFQENHEEGKKKLKLHECPFCHKVFRSGQALGGHKRSHIMNSSSTTTTTTPSSSVKLGGSLVNSSKSDHLFIDLNLPAPMEEEDEEEEEDFSAVSDAEFTNPINAFTSAS